MNHEILLGPNQDLPAAPGSYALLLWISGPGRVPAGRLGALAVAAGWYLYLGSALGPGGLAARCRHHLGLAARPHWHLDYLRPLGQVAEIWVRPGPERWEHAWAELLAGWPGATRPFPGFGASDCRCLSHLVRFPERPDFARFQRQAGPEPVRRWIPPRPA